MCFLHKIKCFFDNINMTNYEEINNHQYLNDEIGHFNLYFKMYFKKIHIYL